MRITRLDVQYWIDHVNDILRASNKPLIGYRQHYMNSYTVLVQLDHSGEEVKEPFFAGTKAEVVEQLRAMVRMHSMLTES